MRVIGIILALLTFIHPAAAQVSENDDRGYLQALLEDNLSDAGRVVRIKGFKGALSSKASVDELTIADDTGIWITLTGVVLEWDRSDLLSGKLNVTKLTAKEILLPRLPEAETGLSTDAAEASTFALPELPVSVRIGEISAGRVLVGQPVFGVEVELTVLGSMSLADGNGFAKLKVERTDARGDLTLDTYYSNSTNVLALELAVREAADGIAANLLGLPGRPALSLEIKGEDLLSDYRALVKLASDGAPRLQGEVKISAADVAGTEQTGRQFSAILEGDISPLLVPEYRGFFGTESTLSLLGFRQDTGALEISELKIAARALSLTGELDLSAEGWPTRFRLDGRLSDEEPVRLPISGPGTWISEAQISAAFDAAQGNEWRTEIAFSGLEQHTLKIAGGTLTATGTISDTAPQSVAAHVAFDVAGVDHTDKALARALGSSLSGVTDLSWQENAPLEISGLSLRSGEVALRGSGTLDGLTEGFPVSGSVRIVTGALERFGPALGRELSGHANARITGTGTLLGGAFDIELDAETTDLVTGIARLDPLLKEKSRLELAARRDTEGTVLDRLRVTNDAATLNASGRVDSKEGQFDLSARLTDVALVEPGLTGPAAAEAALIWAFDGDVTLQFLNIAVAGAQLNASGTVSPHLQDVPATGRFSASFADLSRFAALAGRPLDGRLALALDGSGALEGRDFQLTATAEGSGLATGMAQLDQLITGDMQLSAVAGREGDRIDIRTLSFSTSQLALTAEASDDAPGAPLRVDARLANLGLFAPEFSGPLNAVGTVDLQGPEAREIRVELTAEGPGGTTARISGDIFDHGDRADLALTGTAPMALANSFISPRSVQGNVDYDLRLSGRPSLAALSGTARTANARLALPRIGLAVEGVTGTATLSGGSAQLALAGRLRDGGAIRVTGPVTLTAPFPGDITAELTGVILTDRQIYTTSVDGSISVQGALTGGATIAGTLTLGETEIRIPSSDATETVMLEGIRHIHEPAAVAATRRRAGLTGRQKGGPASTFPLDLTINAPKRIFVRGRGLDAELGGRLRLTGTTTDVIPSGFFQLIRGRLDILGKRLTLTEGLVDLRGALDPYLRFVAESEAEDVTVLIIIEGLASALEITFQSLPELPQEEVVSQLLFGRGLDSISPFQAAQLVSAIATLAGRSNNDVVGRLRDTIGLSDLDVTSTEEGTTQVRAGAYLSDNVYSEVTADSEGRQEINLNLDVSPKLTVKGGLDSEGGTGLGIFFEKDY